MHTQASRRSSPWICSLFSWPWPSLLFSSGQGLLCLSQPMARGPAVTGPGAPSGFAHILLQSGPGLPLMPLRLPPPRSALGCWPGLVGCRCLPAGGSSFLSPAPHCAALCYRQSPFHALIPFRPGSDACLRQNVWAANFTEPSDLPVCELWSGVGGRQGPGGKNSV